MYGKKHCEKIEEFAKSIIELSADKGLTVHELYEAADVAKQIAVFSAVDKGSIGRADYPSQHIIESCACGVFSGILAETRGCKKETGKNPFII